MNGDSLVEGNAVYKKYSIAPPAEMESQTGEGCADRNAQQNILVRRIRYPLHIYLDENGNGDQICSVYLDRLKREDYEAAARKVVPTGNINGAFFMKLDDQQIIEWGKALFGKDHLDGMQIVEFTHMSNGYPLFRVSCFIKGKDTPEPEYPAKHRSYVYYRR